MESTITGFIVGVIVGAFGVFYFTKRKGEIR